ncbi:MAG: mobile mystery protein A [Rhodocyclaceae bacterium]|nr:mobile mystery protein A [Rhodocyclaceae bacterium]
MPICSSRPRGWRRSGSPAQTLWSRCTWTAGWASGKGFGGRRFDQSAYRTAKGCSGASGAGCVELFDILHCGATMRFKNRALRRNIMRPSFAQEGAAMNNSFLDLQRHQLDAALDHCRQNGVPARPAAGWLRAIREGLGMAAVHLAARLGVAPSTISRMEHSEVDDTISLATLRRAAEALGCELHYVLLPRQSLAATREAQARQVAHQQVAQVSHSMALEAQATPPEVVEAHTRLLVEALLKGPRRQLWRTARSVPSPDKRAG